MDKAAALDTIARFRKAIESRGINISKLILYGSYARGDYREGSDIDLILISEDFKNHDYWSRIDILSEAIYDVFEPLEVVGFTPEEWENKTSPLYDYAKQGEILYAA
jgi:predicted nucleotidyltransferase